MSQAPSYPGAPRWVKVSGIVAGVLAVLLGVVVLAGGEGHGPGGHRPPGATGGHGAALPLLLGGLVLAGAALNWRWLVDRALPRPGRFARAPRTMTPGFRKLVLVAHVASSVGALGAVAVFLALAVVGLASSDAQTVRAAYIANAIVAWHLVLPLILAALLIGIMQSLGTPWGLFRHYWVLAKLMLTIVTVYVLLSQMDGIDHIAAETALSGSDLLGLRRSLRFHAAGGLVVLLVLVALSIFKPRGLTLYGWRKRHGWDAPPRA